MMRELGLKKTQPVVVEDVTEEEDSDDHAISGENYVHEVKNPPTVGKNLSAKIAEVSEQHPSNKVPQIGKHGQFVRLADNNLFIYLTNFADRYALFPMV